MNISIDKHFFLFLKDTNIESLEKSPNVSSHYKNNKIDADIVVDWGDDRGFLTTETGFFEKCIHIDKIGLYEKCSLNSLESRKLIEDYNPPYDIINNEVKNKIIPKFNITKSNISHTGPILICQHPNDRSILRVGGSQKYYEFVEDACRYFGKNLFLKFHPVNSLEIRQKHIEIADKYNCQYGYTGIDVINESAFIILFNSTFAIDALFKNKHIFQYSPGYFYKSNIVKYIEGDLTKCQSYSIDTYYMNRFLNFIIWKYCFRYNQSPENIIEIIKSFKNDGLFPLPEQYSYGNYLMSL